MGSGWARTRGREVASAAEAIDVAREADEARAGAGASSTCSDFTFVKNGMQRTTPSLHYFPSYLASPPVAAINTPILAFALCAPTLVGPSTFSANASAANATAGAATTAASGAADRWSAGRGAVLRRMALCPAFFPFLFVSPCRAWKLKSRRLCC